jgi:16S rRNA (uracil1498-N3)-methyltransferase
MRRFFVDPENLAAPQVTLEGDEFHHLRNVSRLEEGEFVELLDGQGQIAKAKIVTLKKKSALLEVIERRVLPPMPQPHIEIVLCLPRFQKMDLIIQKAAELGATKISPVVSERSFLKALSKEFTGKFARWQKISLEACKQSGRAWPMSWGEPRTLEVALDEAKGNPGLFLFEGETALDIKSALQKFLTPPKTLTLFIGAEGGFSPQEVEKFKAFGFEPVTLGQLVLRVETACIAILSVIEYHFGLMR